jgi:hypothetical protein
VRGHAVSFDNDAKINKDFKLSRGLPRAETLLEDYGNYLAIETIEPVHPDMPSVDQLTFTTGAFLKPTAARKAPKLSNRGVVQAACTESIVTGATMNRHIRTATEGQARDPPPPPILVHYDHIWDPEDKTLVVVLPKKKAKKAKAKK